MQQSIFAAPSFYMQQSILIFAAHNNLIFPLYIIYYISTSSYNISHIHITLLYLQLVLDTLSISASIILSLTESFVLEEKALLVVENFVLKQMTLIKTFIAEIKVLPVSLKI